MTTITAVPEHNIARNGTQSSTIYFGRPRTIGTLYIKLRSEDEILADFLQVWSTLIPARMPDALVQRILKESPELPASEDPSTYEFANQED